MANLAVTPTTTADLNKIWRKVQKKVRTAWQFTSDEWEMISDMEEYEVDWSTREITIPLDMNDDAGVASIPEGGWEAVPMSPNVEEISLAFVWLNKRFTVTHTAKAVDQRSKNAMLTSQIKYQGNKAQQAIGRHWSDQVYGFSTGVLATTTTAATQASGTYVLALGYGHSSVTDPYYIANLFRKGDRVAAVRSGALADANAIGTITADPTVSGGNAELAITWNGSWTSVSGDQLVLANSVENTTLTGGTSYNKHQVGLLDGLTSTSVHGLSSATNARWAVAYSDSTSGRFTGIKLHRAAQEINNKGGGRMNKVYMAQGVERDMIDYYRGAVRISSPFNMEVDGSVKAKGVTFVTTRRVPNGQVVAMDSSSFQKGMLLGKPSAPAWGDGDKIEGRSATAFSMDLPCFLVHLNRANYAHFTNQTES